jgi:exopolyphosphatase / guanosine-5'-triphosphate,3'-diphosphate pyrophosphatase
MMRRRVESGPAQGVAEEMWAARLNAQPIPELAVIDLGSNTARLVLFDTTPAGGFRSIFESKEIPRLGEGSLPDGALSPAAIERGVSAMRRFARQLEAAGSPPIVAVATSAVRDAPNAGEFLARVASETGITVQVLGGEQEGHYAQVGVSAAWSLDQDLVVDLGGGSLQAVATRNGKVDRVVSLPLGSLRLTERFLRHDPPKGREIERLRDHVRQGLRALPKPRSRKYRIFGVGGSIRCLARVAIELTDYPLPIVHGFPLSLPELEVIERRIIDLPAADRREVPGISGHRADVILAGLLTVEELLRVTHREELLVSGTGIREGIALERIGAHLPAKQDELTYRSVTAAARAFGFSLEHGDEVRRVALEWFDTLGKRIKFRPEDRRALAVAAWMHDVGAVVEVWRHPRHSSYLLKHAAILGLSHRETLLAALAVYLHEGDPQPPEWRKEFRLVLGAEDLQRVQELGAILYVAETLDGAKVRLRWAPGNPRRLEVRTRGGAGNEASDKGYARIARMMRRTFDVVVVTDPR